MTRRPTAGLHGIGVAQEFGEPRPPRRRDRNDITTTVPRVRRPAHEAMTLEADDDAVDVVAVQAEDPSDVRLAQRPYSSSADRTAKSDRASSGIRAPVRRAPIVATRPACQLTSVAERAGRVRVVIGMHQEYQLVTPTIAAIVGQTNIGPTKEYSCSTTLQPRPLRSPRSRSRRYGGRRRRRRPRLPRCRRRRRRAHPLR